MRFLCTSILALSLATLASAQTCEPRLLPVDDHSFCGVWGRIDSLVSHPRQGTPMLFALVRGRPEYPPGLNDPEPVSSVLAWDHTWTRFGYEGFNRRTTLASVIAPDSDPYWTRLYAVGYPAASNPSDSATLSSLSDSDWQWQYSPIDTGRALVHNTPLAAAPLPGTSDPALIIGGDFRTLQSSCSNLVLGCTWRCECTTSPLAVNDTSNVRALAFYALPSSNQRQLYAGGTNLLDPFIHLVRWNGFAWEPLYYDLNDVSDLTGLKAHGDSLWITTQNRTYRYNDQGFQALPPLAGVECLEWFDDGSGEHLYAGGSFSITPGAPAHQVAMFDGAAWQPVGPPFSDSEVAPIVKSLAVHDTGQGPRLVAAGYFHRSGDKLLNNIATWNGAAWKPLGQSVFSRAATYHDDGVSSDLYTVTWSLRDIYDPRPDRVVRLHNGETQILGDDFPMGSEVEHIYSFDFGSGPELFVVGSFSQAPGGVPAQGIARWDGAQWHGLGTVVLGQTATIHGAVLWDEDGPGPGAAALYVTGNFTTLGGTPANNVARWNGTTWTPLAGGLTQPGGFINIRQGSGINELLVLTSDITESGQLARWSGQWTVAPGTFYVRTYEAGNMMAVYDSGDGPDVYVTNEFSMYRLVGSTWSPVNIPQSGTTIATFDDGRGPALYTSGGDDIYRWTPHEFQRVCTIDQVRDLNPSFNGTTHGLLATQGRADFGAYFLQPCHLCGSADFNHDGDTGTDQDIAAFFACLSGACCPLCDTADFNADGDTGTDQDIEAFFRVLAGGTC